MNHIVTVIFVMARGRRKVVKRRVKRRRTQRGGAAFRRKKPRLVDKIAEGASMFLAGPAPSFASAGAKLAGQAWKGIHDNWRLYRRGRR